MVLRYTSLRSELCSPEHLLERKKRTYARYEGQLSIINCQLSIINYQLSIAMKFSKIFCPTIPLFSG